MISLLTSPRLHVRYLLQGSAAALAIVLAATPLLAANCWDRLRPDSRYVIDSANSTVVDKVSKLTWRRCESGYTGNFCHVYGDNFNEAFPTFDEAVLTGINSRYLGYNDWRSATVDELIDLMPLGDCTAPDEPVINYNVFPRTNRQRTWSGTPSGNAGVFVSFAANIYPDNRGILGIHNRLPARYVRGDGLADTSISTPQVLTFGPAPTLTKGQSGSSVSATSNVGGPNSGNPIDFFSATPSVCDVGQLSGEIIVPATAALGDTCTIFANQYGRTNNGVNYAQGQATQSMLVGCWDTHPNSRYVVNSGTVLDTATGLSGNNNLMWKQCVEGMSGASCGSGSPTTMSFDDAGLVGSMSTHAGYNDWRAPTLAELQTLVPGTCAAGPFAPTINRTVFPATPSAPTWTATSTVLIFRLGAAVDFMNGSESNLQVTNANPVRLVRGGQSLPSTPQTLAFGPAPTLVLGTSPTVSATNTAGSANSGNPIRYSSATPLVCSVDAISGQITLTSAAAAGNTCTINADQYGRINNGVNYAPAAQIAQSLIVIAPVNGTCATLAPSTTAPAVATLCTAGTAANFASGVTNFTWACNGSNGGTNVTTCSSIRQYTVTTNPGANGTLSCSTPVNGGATTTCTSAPNAGYRTASISGCNGTTTAAGINSYTTGAIIADCQVSASFESVAQNIVWAPLDPSVRALDLVGSFTINPLAVGGASGNPVTYSSATPLVCSVSGLNGVLVTQLGLGVCTITANQQGDAIYSAATPTNQSVTFVATLDIDASSASPTRYHASTDGILIMRYLLNVTGSALTSGVTAPTALRTDPVALVAHLNAMRSTLDVDGNTVVDPATDGVLVLRYLLGFRGDALISGAVATSPTPSRPTAALIESYLQSLMP